MRTSNGHVVTYPPETNETLCPCTGLADAFDNLINRYFDTDDAFFELSCQPVYIVFILDVCVNRYVRPVAETLFPQFVGPGDEI